MKPVPIADYLDHIGRSAGDKPGARREASPFRPRSLQTVQTSEPRSLPAFDRIAKPALASKPKGEERPLKPAFERMPAPIEPLSRESLASREAAKAAEIALRLAEAHAKGREEGYAEGRFEAEEQRELDIAALQEQAVMERLDFQLNEYAGLEVAIRAGFAEVEDRIETAVARILAPFLVKEVVKTVVDELCKNIGRLCAGGAPGLITVRGPERVLALLRDRVADLPAEFDFLDDGGVEAVVEANATHIVTELRPWTELLSSLDS